MAKLYLIRHAQSENNVIWDGRGDHQPGRKVTINRVVRLIPKSPPPGIDRPKC